MSGGLVRPGGLYAFSCDWVACEVASGIETAEETAHEIRAWCIFKEKPAAQWCDFDSCMTQPTALGRCPNCGLILDLTRLMSVWPLMGYGFGNFMLPVQEDSVGPLDGKPETTELLAPE